MPTIEDIITKLVDGGHSKADVPVDEFIGVLMRQAAVDPNALEKLQLIDKFADGLSLRKDPFILKEEFQKPGSREWEEREISANFHWYAHSNGIQGPRTDLKVIVAEPALRSDENLLDETMHQILDYQFGIHGHLQELSTPSYGRSPWAHDFRGRFDSDNSNAFVTLESAYLDAKRMIELSGYEKDPNGNTQPLYRAERIYDTFKRYDQLFGRDKANEAVAEFDTERNRGGLWEKIESEIKAKEERLAGENPAPVEITPDLIPK